MKENIIIQTAFLGDCVLSIPLFKWLKRHSSEPITFLTRKGYGSFFKEIGLADKVIEFDKTNKSESWHKINEAVLNTEYNYAFCPHRSPRSQLLLNNLSADHKVSFHGHYSKKDLSYKAVYNEDEHEVYRVMRLAEAVDKTLFDGITKKKITNHTLSEALPLNINKRFSLKIEKYLRPSSSSLNKKVVIAPGSVWSTKKWPEAYFKKVVKYFLNKNYQVFITGAPGDMESCNKVMVNSENAVNLAGKQNIYQLLKTMQSSDVLISNDSGAQHIAAIAGLPTVSLFGPTRLEIGYRPFNEKAIVLQNSKLSCSPCGLHGQKVCPTRTHECMTSISPEEVIKKAEMLLKIF